MGEGLFLPKFQILYQFFLESNNENDNKFYARVNLTNELHHNVNFSISYKKKKIMIKS